MKIKFAFGTIICVFISTVINSQKVFQIDTLDGKGMIRTIEIDEFGDTAKVTFNSYVEDRSQFFYTLTHATKLSAESIRNHEGRDARIYKKESVFFRTERKLDSIITKIYRKPSTYPEYKTDTLEVWKKYLYYSNNDRKIKSEVYSSIDGKLLDQLCVYDHLNRVIKERYTVKIKKGMYGHILYPSYVYGVDIQNHFGASSGGVKIKYHKNTNLIKKRIDLDINGTPMGKSVNKYDDKNRLICSKSSSFNGFFYSWFHKEKMTYKNDIKIKSIEYSKACHSKKIKVFNDKGEFIKIKTKRYPFYRKIGNEYTSC